MLSLGLACLLAAIGLAWFDVTREQAHIGCLLAVLSLCVAGFGLLAVRFALP